MIKSRYIVGQVLAYSAFAAMVAYFSEAPKYVHHAPGNALVKLSVTHAGQRVGECHQRSAEELAKLAPNMRAKQACGRERSSVTLEMDIDGKPAFSQTAKPAGLSGDGRSRFYSSREVPAGEHRIQVRMRDSGRASGFDYEVVTVVDLAARQVFVIDFDDENKKIIFQ
ncbi:MAG: hypothetical protein HYU60_00660 [Magnetospirillum sp.]|nr:hypothetical protein [Magnetospirillum sp.]